MVEIRQTEVFHFWLSSLKDARAKAKISARIQRIRFGNPGDVKPVGSGVSEMRIEEGPGYRVYFVQRGEVVIVLLSGGTKARQQEDIAQAKRLAEEWEG
ncbi:MAG: type II toxin-antitoxin system RelE/ParE family toxin [Pseudomonadota bacterium]